MKSNVKSKIVIGAFVVMILLIGIGYAAFSDTLSIIGTANSGGKFDLEFTEGTGLVTSTGVNASETKAVISSDKNTLTVTVADLSYPGAGAQFQAVIKNTGSVAAKVKGLTESKNLTGADSIKITGLDNIISGESVIQPNGTCTINFTVEWDKTKELTNSEGDSVSFELGIEYEQETEEFTGSASHTHENP